ncbi:MAG: metallophosphoesterase family protein [Candidatus Brocadiia bacterium]
MPCFSPRYGIISDIHSNLAALRAVLEALEKERVASYLCMGDVVGYGASPHEVIAELDHIPLHCIRGNHDRYALGEDTDQIRSATAEAIAYTRECLTAADMSFLRGLEDTLMFEDRVLIAHGSPRDRDEYIIANEAAIANYRHFRSEFAGVDLCFFGHTHIPMFIGDGKVIRQIEPGQRFALRRMTPYMINVGSVGQPRDGDPDAAYGVLDLEERTIAFKRVPYDVEDTRQRILDAGLQRHLGDRLRAGR